MSIVMTTAYLAATGVDSWKTRICYENLALGETLTASSEESGTFLEAVVSDQTWEFWQPDALPAWWQVEFTGSTDIDYVAIAAHTLGSCGCTIKVQYDDGGWNDVTGTSHSPTDDDPIIILFGSTSSTKFRLYITGSGDMPQIGVMYFGEVLELDRPAKWMGHTPSYFNWDIVKRPTASERGQRLGTSLIRQAREGTFNIDLVSETWMRSTFGPFILAAQRYGYFIAWRPTQFANEVFFGWTDSPIIPNNSKGGTTRKMSVSWDMTIHVQPEAD